MVEKLKNIDLGRSGLKASELGCGGIPIMRVGLEEAKLIIRHCFQLGIRFFDTAHVYNDSEEKMGLALEPVRDEVVLATKVWAKDASYVPHWVNWTIRIMGLTLILETQITLNNLASL